ncbi:hypothetical protein H8958_002208 [Nasalis larvatus]
MLELFSQNDTHYMSLNLRTSDVANKELMKNVKNMDSYSLQAFQNEIICSICMNYFIDPVTIDCGHNFCRSCLSLCCEEGREPVRCPECRKISAKLDFNTNVALKTLASLARQTRPQNINNSHNICVLHEETKELFCEADKQLLCGPCSESP